MIEWFPIRSYRLRKDIDFKDLDMYDFKFFEDVEQPQSFLTFIQESMKPFVISDIFSANVANGIYDYCYGKMINLKNEKRWTRNFEGEIRLYFAENARYLQAYARDVNKGIDQGNSTTVTTTGEEQAGTADTRKRGDVENAQDSAVGGSDQQSGTINLGDTLTVLNNQTTSTTHLASSNEENYSTGSTTESADANFQKRDLNTIKLGMENGASLSDKKHESVVKSEETLSPLGLALSESSFKFREWYDPLLEIIDTYFMVGGNDYA